MAILKLILSFFMVLLCSQVQAIQFQPNAEGWWEDTPWHDPDRGFNWYPDPREEARKEEKKPPEQKPKTLYEMSSLEEVKKELERIKGVAVINPTEKNVYEYLKAQNYVMNKASVFADVSRRVVWSNADVNYSARSPTASFATSNARTRQAQARKETVAELAQTHAILFFARSDCDFCHDQAPVLKGFSLQTGMPILTVSLDGKPIHMFPDAKPDNGIAMLASGGLGIQVVPAMFLIDRRTQQMTPLGTGVIAVDDLEERIRVMTRTKPGQEF